MKNLFLVLSLAAPLSSFAALRAECVAKVQGQTVELALLTYGKGLQLKSEDLSIGNATNLPEAEQNPHFDSRVYEGTLDCNSFVRGVPGAVTEMNCAWPKATVVMPEEIAAYGTADALPLGENFQLEMTIENKRGGGDMKLNFSCETTMILSRTL